MTTTTDQTNGHYTRVQIVGKITQDFIAEFIFYLLQGMPDSDACRLAGIGPQVGASWVDRGRQFANLDFKASTEDSNYEPPVRQHHEELYLKLYYEYIEANPKRKYQLLDTLNRATIGHTVTETTTHFDPVRNVATEIVEKERYIAPNLKVAQWLLEKEFPEDYNPPPTGKTISWDAQIVVMIQTNQINLEDVKELLDADLYHEFISRNDPATLTVQHQG